jgi:hypothetical protein
MKTFASGRTTMIAVVCALAAAFAIAAGPVARPANGQGTANKLSKVEVLQKAHAAYYTLQAQGLKNFQVNIEPNWKQFIDDMKRTQAPSEQKMAVLSLIQCSVTVDSQGAATVTPYSTDGKPIDHIADDSVSGLKQMVQGFYQTWSAMVITSVFPDVQDTSFTMQEQSDGYLFTGSGPSAGQEFVLSKDYLLTSMKVVSGGTLVAIIPKYTKIDKGLLLTGIASDINNGAQQIGIQIQYQLISGFQLPTHVWFRITAPNQAPILIDMEVNKYQVNKP